MTIFRNPIFAMGLTALLAAFNLYQHPHMDGAAAWSTATVTITWLVNTFAHPIDGAKPPEVKP